MRSCNERVQDDLLAAGAELERQHVQLVYDAIARQWHGTRYKAWPRVVDFVRDLPPRSLVADLGCGNGKLAPSFRDAGHIAIGCDFSAELVGIAAGEMGMQAVVANCLCLPYRDDSFDAALSIAVLHHISSLPRRQRLVAETMRILRPGGRALFYAWAQEQHDGRSGHAFGSRDVLVPFHRREQPGAPPAPVPAGGLYDHSKRATVFQRYCHVYTEGELRQLLQSVDGCRIRDEYYDTGNWCALVEKDAEAPSPASQARAMGGGAGSYDTGSRCAAVDQATDAPTSAGLASVVKAMEGGAGALDLPLEEAVLESGCGGAFTSSSAHAGMEGGCTAGGGSGLDPHPWSRGAPTGPCASARLIGTQGACTAGSDVISDGPNASAATSNGPAVTLEDSAVTSDGSAESAVLAHLEGMLHQVQAIAGAADAVQREVQYDALAQMLEQARLAGAM